MTQKENILNHLKVYGSITPLSALQSYGVFRLGAIVHKLRQEGMDIKTNINKGDKKYAIYTFAISE